MAENAESIDIIYFGNPVFDISVNDPDRDVMGRYSLELGMACLASPEQIPIYQELWNREDKLTSPGGSALNSARAQKHCNANGSVAYFGCIGNDAYGESLSAAVNQAGVIGRFETTSEDRTALCACVIVGKERTLCADIAAAKKFSMAYLQAHMVSLLSTADAIVIV